MIGANSPEQSTARRLQREPIIVDGKRFVWITNFNTSTQASQRQSPNHPFPENQARHRNGLEVYFEMVKRGIGVVPETRPTNFEGREMQSGFAFYIREELGSIMHHKVLDYLKSKFPTAFNPNIDAKVEGIVLTPNEISVLMDVALEETGLQARLDELGIA